MGRAAPRTHAAGRDDKRKQRRAPHGALPLVYPEIRRLCPDGAFAVPAAVDPRPFGDRGGAAAAAGGPGGAGGHHGAGAAGGIILHFLRVPVRPVYRCPHGVLYVFFDGAGAYLRAGDPQLPAAQPVYSGGGGADYGVFLPGGAVPVPVFAGGGGRCGPGAAAVRPAPCRLFGGAGGAAVLPGAGAAPHGRAAHRYPTVS